MKLDKLREKAKGEWQKIEKPSLPIIFVGSATCGRAAGALKVIKKIEEFLFQKKTDAKIIEVGCIGMCFSEVIIDIAKPNIPRILYHKVTPENVSTILEEHLIKDNPLKEMILGTLSQNSVDGIPSFTQHPFFQEQKRIALRNCGVIDPENIYHYIAKDGYKGLELALTLTPEKIIEEVKKSGLRGRGGGGFSTGMKWEFCRKAVSDKRLAVSKENREPKTESRAYIVCNADEGDPGAFMDRSLLESDTHSVLEGMVIGAYAIGANEGYIYVRAEYPLAIKRLKVAISQMKDRGLLGDNILGSGFSFHIKIKEGAGAFVCGEETALIASIEGKRGMPRSRPPFPAQSGLWGKPTIINNVETFANISFVLAEGADLYASYGTEKSKGTKTFALAGKINHTGLIEVEMGITLKDIIYKVGGGIPQNKKFKAVQTGGPSGGCIPADLLDLPVDYDSLTSAGSIMGSGGMVVMDEDTCMVDIARYFIDFTQQESCGKCVPCRLGTKHLLNILNKIVEGEGEAKDIDILLDLSLKIKSASLCGLGQTAPNPVLTTLCYFKEEYEAHIHQKKCPALSCKKLITYYVAEDKCKACMLCLRACPVEAISGGKKQIHKIIQEKCIKCGVCYDICPAKFSAIVKLSGIEKKNEYNH